MFPTVTLSKLNMKRLASRVSNQQIEALEKYQNCYEYKCRLQKKAAHSAAFMIKLAI
ncbi:MAG: hypothetical protein ACI8VI_001406 [Granulosicoccus sp.]|jgi:hypothetical protein